MAVLGLPLSAGGEAWPGRALPTQDVLQDPLVVRGKHQLVVVDQAAELDGDLLQLFLDGRQAPGKGCGAPPLGGLQEP